MVSSNTETNIAVTYDDASGKLNFAVDDIALVQKLLVTMLLVFLVELV